ncbi:MAG: pyrroline-5-carboxylate reductase [Oleiphilaceae bacterium]|jgi:pyrroline-5-carboxylate reductase
MNLNDNKICFIGAGNMASCIIGGLLKNGFPAQQVIASAPSNEKNLNMLKDTLNIEVSTNNQQAVINADIIVLSVKPQVLQTVCEEISNSLSHQPLIISIAAGISIASIHGWLGNNLPIIRCMPNTPSQVMKGASGLIENSQVSDAQKQAASELFAAIGIVEWLKDENQIHAVTALSGSGPAYIFLVIEAMEAAAIKQGLSPETARRLAAQTVAGAAEMVLSSDIEPAQLKRNVMSPGGTTERAIQTFESLGLVSIFEAAINAAAERSIEMSAQLKG